MSKLKDHLLSEASSSMAMDKFDELHDLLMKNDAKEKLKDAGMKIQKQAAKTFQQAISLLKGLK